LATTTVRVAQRRLQYRRARSFLGFDEVDPRDVTELFAKDASAEDRALLSRVYSELDDVSAKERVAWTLRYVEGEPLESIATLCGCSLATAKRRIATVESFLEKRLRS
jgi:RNA polymerase sigma-70 factor (ECF subfamily)